MLELAGAEDGTAAGGPRWTFLRRRFSMVCHRLLTARAVSFASLARVAAELVLLVHVVGSAGQVHQDGNKALDHPDAVAGLSAQILEHLDQRRYDLVLEYFADPGKVDEERASLVHEEAEDVQHGATCLQGWLEVPDVLVRDGAHDSTDQGTAAMRTGALLQRGAPKSIIVTGLLMNEECGGQVLGHVLDHCEDRAALHQLKILQEDL